MLAPTTMLEQAEPVLRLLAGITLLSVPVAASAAPLPPTGKWTVDYATANCAASRPFGPGEQPLTLTIKPAHSGGSARLVLSNAWTELKVNHYTATVDFMDGGKPFRTDASPAMAFGPSRAVVILDLPADQVVRLRSSQTLRVASGGILDRTFAIGKVGPLFDVMDKCLSDLRTYWSVGVVPAQRAVPAHDLAKLFSWSNYPTVGDHIAKSNRVTARLLIDEKGNVRDCAITAGTGATALDIQTCQVFERRVQYRPAIDRTGNPMRSAVDETIIWRR